MGLRTGGYLTVWEVNDKGKYADCRCSSSKRNKQTKEYETDFSGYVRFIGKAHDVAIALQGEHPKVKVGEFEVTNNYSKEKGVTYTNFAVFTCDPEENAAANQGNQSSEEKYDQFMNIPDGIDEEIPFN